MNSIESNTKNIEFKLNLRDIKNKSEIEEAVFKFFDEIKAEVYEKAKASQKKYFKIDDTFDMVLPEYVDQYYQVREAMDYFSLLEKNEKWFRDNNKLKDKIEEYYQAEYPKLGWSATESGAFHGNASIKRFDKEYDSFTRTILEENIQYSNYHGYKICFIELKFIFTNFCKSDWCCRKYNDDGCMYADPDYEDRDLLKYDDSINSLLNSLVDDYIREKQSAI